MAAFPASPRRGISLMEVLIAIGILAVGLSSVVALVPAGKSEAGRAVMLDRAAYLATNVLHDAVTFGLTRPASFTAAGQSDVVVFDPLYLSSGTAEWNDIWPGADAGVPKPAPALASADPFPVDSYKTSMPLLFSILRGGDDVVYKAPVKEDDPPLNVFTTGTPAVRSSLGRTTALLSIATTTGSLSAGSLAKVTAVVFHNRNLVDPGDAVIDATYNEVGSPLGTLRVPTLPPERAIRSTIRPGTVVYFSGMPPAQRWQQIAMASANEATGDVYVTYVGDAVPTTTQPVKIALDSVGLAERFVTLEGPGPYGR